MSWSKRDLILQAYEEIGLANHVFDLEPEQLESGRRKLDAMMAGWSANGVRVGYPLTRSPSEGDLDDDSNLPDWAVEAAYSNLAIRLAPAHGKVASAELKQLADGSYNNLVNQATLPTIERQLPHTMPRGGGNKPWRNYINPFINKQPEEIQAGDDGPLTLE